VGETNSPYDGGSYGREQIARGRLPRHRHPFGYICVVLRGSFVEAGDAGRFRVAPGDVLVHRPFEAHLDQFDGAGADVLNLPLAAANAEGRYAVHDLDAVARLAETDPLAAARSASAGWTARGSEQDWPDLLARDLRRDDRLSLAGWASRHGLAPATLSRGFRLAYGTTPVRYRAELRARRAWAAIAATHSPLAELALDEGFADQAHMTRAVRALTGAPPAHWRARVKSVQEICPSRA
jgi:AraC-like DNA-binding protein